MALALTHEEVEMIIALVFALITAFGSMADVEVIEPESGPDTMIGSIYIVDP